MRYATPRNSRLPNGQLCREERTAPGRLSAIACAVLCVAGGQALAQSALPTAKILPSSVMLGFETVRLPGGERMGLVGGSFLFDIGDDWGLGPGVYGASAGQRGGLFVGGVEVQKRVALGRSTALALGMYAGGGGGAGAPVGSGLMLRPARMRRFLILVGLTPWRRSAACTWFSPPARISPRTCLPLRSLPSHSKTSSFRPFDFSVAMV